MYMNNEISISIRSLPARYRPGSAVCSDSKSPTSREAHWAPGGTPTPCNTLAWEPLETLLGGKLTSDQLLPTSDAGGGGHPLNLPWPGVGLWVVMLGGGPESWGLTIGLGACGQASLWPLQPVGWGWPRHLRC